MINTTNLLKRVQNKVDFVFTTYEEDKLYLTYLNNSNRQFYIENKTATFYICSESKVDTIFSKLIFNNYYHDIILTDSEILIFEFRPKDEAPEISINRKLDYNITCVIKFNLKYSVKDSVKKELSIKFTPEQMAEIIEYMSEGGGS